jgi:hypothetical protein
MLYEEELTLLFSLGRHFSGNGEIVDAGCFLGGSTFALAAGLAARRRDVSSRARVIHSYDLFRLDALTKMQYPQFTKGVEVDASIRPEFERLLASHLSRLHVHEGDIRDFRWNGEPIEILFLDVCKSWEVNDHVLHQFFPALIPRKSVVIQQDFVHEWLPYIPVTMGMLADAFEFAGYVPPSTALFVPSRQIESEEIPASLRDDLPDPAKLEFFDRACGPFAGEEKAVLDCARAMLLLDLGRRYEAAETLNEIQAESSDRVARAVGETRSWLLRSDPDPTVALPEWQRWRRATGA